MLRPIQSNIVQYRMNRGVKRPNAVVSLYRFQLYVENARRPPNVCGTRDFAYC
jgi:hypothetical protein